MKAKLTDEELIREVESLAWKLSYPEILNIQQLIYRYRSAICGLTQYAYTGVPIPYVGVPIPYTMNIDTTDK